MILELSRASMELLRDAMEMIGDRWRLSPDEADWHSEVMAKLNKSLEASGAGCCLPYCQRPAEIRLNCDGRVIFLCESCANSRGFLDWSRRPMEPSEKAGLVPGDPGFSYADFWGPEKPQP